MGKNKIKILKDFFGTDKIDGVAFSDSPTDLPLLEFVTNGYVVGANQQFVSWAQKHNMKTLIYTPKEYFQD